MSERLQKALTALTDDELLAVVGPLDDLRQVLTGDLQAVTFLSNHPNVARDLPTVVGNPRAVEFYDALTEWMVGEMAGRLEPFVG